MSSDWSREEVELIVADHLQMLTLELAGQSYSKAAHRRNLQRKLHGRSDGSIEFKHCNISAVLNELGFPAIEGYKPRRNYQRLLAEVVADRLKLAGALVRTVAADVESPVAPPSV